MGAIWHVLGNCYLEATNKEAIIQLLRKQGLEG